MKKEKTKILLVDDDPKIIELLKVNLESENYEIDIAYDGEQALAKIWDKGVGRPDLIILDLMLPKMDGYNVARKIKSRNSTSNIPIIMLTGRNNPLDKIEGLINSEADYYFTKPVDINDLLIRIFKILSVKSN